MYKKVLEGKKAVFFDLDGTLIDSEPVWRQAFKNILKTIHMEWFNHEELPVGVGVSFKWEYILEKYKDFAPQNPSIKQLTEQTFHEYIRLIKENPLQPRLGFWEFAYDLKENKNLKMALVSNSPKIIVTEAINMLGVTETFDFVIAGDEIKKPKPDPEIYLTSAKNMKLKTEEILVFEDSLPGASAAYAAQMDTVIIWDNTIPQYRYPPTVKFFVPDFDGLSYMLSTDIDEEFKKSAEGMRNQPNNPTGIA